MIDEEIYDFLKSLDLERWHIDSWVSDFSDEELKEFIESIRNSDDFKNK